MRELISLYIIFKQTYIVSLSATSIREPSIDMILISVKTWEIRRKNTRKRCLIGLIRSGSKTVVATANLSEVVLLTRKLARDNAELMDMTAGEALSCVGEYAWVLDYVVAFKKPVPYIHPSGAVTWVILDEPTTKKVMSQSKLSHL